MTRHPREALYLSVERLVWKETYRLASRLRSVEIDDIYSTAAEAAWRACLAYDPAKGALTTIVVKYIVTAVLTLARKEILYQHRHSALDSDSTDRMLWHDYRDEGDDLGADAAFVLTVALAPSDEVAEAARVALPHVKSIGKQAIRAYLRDSLEWDAARIDAAFDRLADHVQCLGAV